MKKLILFFMIFPAVLGCKTKQNHNNPSSDNTSAKVVSQPVVAALPHVVIYKTTKDYSRNVPVTLSDDKVQIVSYPHPSDLKSGNSFAYPAKLHNGYWLDNRGIGKDAAFLKFTYEEYSKLLQVPPLEALYKAIIDKDPLTELWDCGARVNFDEDIVKQLNDRIDNGQIEKECKKMK